MQSKGRANSPASEIRTTSSSTDGAADRIKALSRLTVKATNHRDFDLSSAGWSHCVSNQPYLFNGTPTSMSEHLQRMQQMTVDNPDIHFRLLSQDVVVTSCITAAEMFELIEICSKDSIVTLQAMKTNWRCRGGEWWCISCFWATGPAME